LYRNPGEAATDRRAGPAGAWHAEPMTELPDLLASDAERERAVARLRRGASEGRLTVDELDERCARAYSAGSRAAAPASWCTGAPRRVFAELRP
jgi:hypothetical protein